MRSPGCRGGRAAAAVVLLGTVLFSGCASLMGPFRSGPGGLARYDHELRQLLRRDAYDSALARVTPERAQAGDELLRLQFEGLVAHYAGRYRRSNDALQSAAALAEERYTKSVSRALLSVVTSDRALAYDPPTPERLFLHYYGALNYLRQGDHEEAAVEARILSRRLRREADREEPHGARRRLYAALHVFAGAVFEAAGLHNDAGVSYRNAAALADGAGHRPPEEADADGGTPEGARGRPPPLAGGSGGDDAPAEGKTGEVVVLVERGFAPYRVESSLTVLVWPDELERLRGIRHAEAGAEEEADVGPGADGEGAPAGGEAAGREEAPGAEAARVALEVARRSWSGGSGPGRRARAGEDDEDGGPVLLRVAWPEYRSDPPSGGRATLYDEEGLLAPETWRADIAAPVIAEFREDAPVMLAKTLLRAAAKTALAKKVKEELKEEDETVGEVLGTALNVTLALLERADTRCWHLLPAELEVHRLRLPAGRQHLTLEVPGVRDRRVPQRIDLGRVDVPPGGVAVRSVRTWN